MSEYRRPWVAGATYFLTIVTNHRRPILAGEGISAWRRALARARHERPFEVEAGVVLPDHTHLMLRLPSGDTDVSSRIGRAKAMFTRMMRAGGRAEAFTSTARRSHREAGFWQRRFFDRLIRDEDEYALRVDYIHYNPVKHGYVRCPRDWPHSSFHRWVERGVYASDWGRPVAGDPPDFTAIDATVGE